MRVDGKWYTLTLKDRLGKHRRYDVTETQFGMYIGSITEGPDGITGWAYQSLVAEKQTFESKIQAIRFIAANTGSAIPVTQPNR